MISSKKLVKSILKYKQSYMFSLIDDKDSPLKSVKVARELEYIKKENGKNKFITLEETMKRLRLKLGTQYKEIKYVSEKEQLE